MSKRILNKNLGKARAQKNDEFYTQLSDIEQEMKHYRHHFKDKVVYCNCDDPRISNFFKYFSLNFKTLGLKKLITTCYKSQNPDLFSTGDSERAIYLEYDGTANLNEIPSLSDTEITHLQGDGDFRSSEAIELLKQADIVVTNPPFSLFREFVSQLIEYNKKFLIIGHQNAITYKDIFKLIRDGDVWLGVENGGTKWFAVRDHYDITTESRKKIEGGQKYFSMGNVNWFTNLDHPKRHEEKILYRNYDENEYQKFDNYEAINVDKLKDIPADYFGVMGVPITFLEQHNPSQFEIIGLIAGNIKGLAGIPSSSGKDGPYINGKLKYGRILIRRIQQP
ncbi:MAG: adenine-specific methyltransferase EcoRI family protein [Bacteroidetes bacterium]|nr:adenine-specific methyltransferase EcoRI family protein [Bacteroidota bacterium]